MSITKKDIEIILSQGPRTDLSKDFSKASGVALLLSGEPDDLQLLFIKRALNPKDHWSGHLAFPGGKKDEQDPSLLAACLREVREEVGVELKASELMGSLDDLQARRRGNMLEFYIQPFVFFLSEKPLLKPDPREVEKALWVSLDYLLDEKNRTEYVFKANGQELRLPGIRFPDGDILWGLTYMMIQNLFLKLKK
jgi:8-oxo-dGTP pyrophosphatase MutT (NUDIX family)